MQKAFSTLAVTALLFTGCASLNPPSAQSLANIPVVKFGDHAPENQPFILLYPAGADIPVHASVTGSLLGKEDNTTLTVRLKQDVYVYQQWASLDGKTWQDVHHMIDGKIAFHLPGEKDSASPGALSAEFNLK